MQNNQPIITPEKMVEKIKTPLPTKGIITWKYAVSFLKNIKKNSKIKSKFSLLGVEFMILNILEKEVFLVILSGFGISYIKIIIKILKTLGIKEIIIVGNVGVVDEKIAVGEIILPEEAVILKEENFYFQKPYLSLVKKLEKWCQEKGIYYFKGKVWTNEEIFSITLKKLTKLKSIGIICIDMEAYGVFKVCKELKIKVGAVFIAKDLVGKRWEKRENKKEREKYKKREEKIAKIIEFLCQN